MTKEFCIKTDCSEADLGKLTGTGWQIQYMQFMDSGKLHVVFFREVAAASPAPAPQPVVVPAPVPIASKPLPLNMCIVGLDDPQRSVPLTNNKPKSGDTRKVNVPVGDPITQEAMARGREIYNRVVAEGEAAMKAAASSFRPNFKATGARS